MLAASLFFAIVDVRLLALVFHCTQIAIHLITYPNNAYNIGFQPEGQDPQPGHELISRGRHMVVEIIICLKIKFYRV